MADAPQERPFPLHPHSRELDEPGGGMVFSVVAIRFEGGKLHLPNDLREAIDRFIAAYNPIAHPFEWTKEVVHPKSLTRHYADLRN